MNYFPSHWLPHLTNYGGLICIDRTTMINYKDSSEAPRLACISTSMVVVDGCSGG